MNHDSIEIISLWTRDTALKETNNNQQKDKHFFSSNNINDNFCMIKRFVYLKKKNQLQSQIFALYIYKIIRKNVRMYLGFWLLSRSKPIAYEVQKFKSCYAIYLKFYSSSAHYHRQKYLPEKKNRFSRISCGGIWLW
jgi:hypothetical protein